MLKFNIRNQQLSRVDSFRPVEKSVNYLTASFSFLTNDWEGCTKKATCKNVTTGKHHDAEIENDTCLIPWEALTDKGSFEISVRGTNGETTITTSAITVDLGRTLLTGTESNPPTPTELDLIRKSIGNLDELRTKNKESLVDAINELAKQGGGAVDPEEIGRIVEEYLAENPQEETDPTVPEWAKQKEKPKYTAYEVGALSADTLTGAVNDALAQAKESGEFDGEPGYTPQKGIDYYTEADKAEIIAAVLAALPAAEGGSY
ncbi:MAG: hypothetical protein J6V25_04120 [Oscillospiraceae bacterium]|nr:hypothetical protein [Oscillospiraceae bacterium]